MRTLLLASLFCSVSAVVVPQSALAAELCVGGPQPGCHATIQAAVDAAQDGDTIRVGPGTFAGGSRSTRTSRSWAPRRVRPRSRAAAPW